MKQSFLHITCILLLTMFSFNEVKSEDVTYDDRCFDIFQFSDGSYPSYLVDTIQIVNPIFVKVEPHFINFVTTKETLSQYDGTGESFFLQQDNAYLYIDWITTPLSSREYQNHKSKDESALHHNDYCHRIILAPEIPVYEVDISTLNNNDKLSYCYQYAEGTYDFLLILIRGGFYNFLNNNYIECPPTKYHYIPSESLASKTYYRAAAYFNPTIPNKP